MSGERGAGKTAVLRHLAHHPRAASFPDGIVYLPARRQTSADLVQLVFDAFFDSDGICKPTDADIRRGLQEKQALILLDDVDLPQSELEHVLDIAPRSAFVVTTRQRCLWGEARSVELKGLPADDAVSLLEREIERPLEAAERIAAAALCTALDGHPLRVQQAAAIAREQGMSLDVCARHLTPANLVTELMPATDEKQRRAMLAMAALSGVPLRASHVAGIAEVTDIEPLLRLLIRRGIVVSNDARHQLAAGIGDHLRRKEDLNPWANRAITYFTAWCERNRRSPASLLEESDALVRVLQNAAAARRWAEVLRVGRLLEGALIGGARWGAWALVVEQCLAAAKALGDRPAEAWALHEIGTRALCLGDTGLARASLNQAATLREAIDDRGAAAASRRNLAFVVAPEPEEPRKHPSTRLDDRFDLDSLTFRAEVLPPTRSASSKPAGLLALILLLAVVVAGFANWARPAQQSWSVFNVAGIGSFLQR
ncbi:MAG TPA: NB-ARC domain-containing protein, partial [Vicinamibacterales bacterium]|nr:NB-ARC domain-containing protein [Vicinamibacterales bacterium]